MFNAHIENIESIERPYIIFLFLSPSLSLSFAAVAFPQFPFILFHFICHGFLISIFKRIIDEKQKKKEKICSKIYFAYENEGMDKEQNQFRLLHTRKMVWCCPVHIRIRKFIMEFLVFSVCSLLSSNIRFKKPQFDVFFRFLFSFFSFRFWIWIVH